VRCFCRLWDRPFDTGLKFDNFLILKVGAFSNLKLEIKKNQIWDFILKFENLIFLKKNLEKYDKKLE
jgi:hypothetical protein